MVQAWREGRGRLCKGDDELKDQKVSRVFKLSTCSGATVTFAIQRSSQCTTQISREDSERAAHPACSKQ